MFKASPAELRTCADDINRWLAEGALVSQVSQTMPLSEAAEAHRMQEESTLQKSGALAGKIVLIP
jgi:NADPH2:quinone reductase